MLITHALTSFKIKIVDTSPVASLDGGDFPRGQVGEDSVHGSNAVGDGEELRAMLITHVLRPFITLFKITRSASSPTSSDTPPHTHHLPRLSPA